MKRRALGALRYALAWSMEESIEHRAWGSNFEFRIADFGFRRRNPQLEFAFLFHNLKLPSCPLP
jgi:hypothetical protein